MVTGYQPFERFVYVIYILSAIGTDSYEALDIPITHLNTFYIPYVHLWVI